MGRILAIDYGKKRTGLAVTDPLRIIASPLETIPTGKLEAFLKEYVEKEEVDEFVIGYPRQLNNKPSESVKYIDPFLRRLKKIFPFMPVHLADERFTSSMAQKAIIEAGSSRSERREKGLVDRVSASLILQSYLERTERRL